MIIYPSVQWEEKKINSKILERNIILYMGVQGGKEKSLQHPVFPGGHPSKY